MNLPIEIINKILLYRPVQPFIQELKTQILFWKDFSKFYTEENFGKSFFFCAYFLNKKVFQNANWSVNRDTIFDLLDRGYYVHTKTKNGLNQINV